MLRQTEPGGPAAGIEAKWRLDPARLPARFSAPDRAAEGGQRSIDLFADRVVIRRTAAGARMKLQMPVSAFRGVAVRIADGDAGAPDRVEVVLVHADPSFDVPLFAAPDADDVVAEWQLWASTFALPLLVVGADGATREAFPRLGGVMLAPPASRRRRRSAVKARRPSALLRRRPGGPVAGAPVHREREIIARSEWALAQA